MIQVLAGLNTLQVEQHLPMHLFPSLSFIESFAGQHLVPSRFGFCFVTCQANQQAAHPVYDSYYPAKKKSGDFRELCIPPAGKERSQKLDSELLES